MVAGLVLASAIGLGQAVPVDHVRTTEPRIVALVEQGIARSATFRLLVDTLNASDVIVYVEPKLNHRPPSGFLAHRVVARGPARYLRIAVDLHGADERLIGLVAHELQHAVEVAQAVNVRSSQAMVELFERLAIGAFCGGCYETEAALVMQERVLEELRARRPGTTRRGDVL
jgi:bacterioferritin-associated ferredoxin